MRFRVTFTISGTYSTEIVVDSLAELDSAIDIAYQETTFSEYEVIAHDETYVGLDEPAQNALYDARIAQAREAHEHQ